MAQRYKIPFPERRNVGATSSGLQSYTGTIDYYRWDNIAVRALSYDALLHSTPSHSHSMVPGGLLVMS